MPRSVCFVLALIAAFALPSLTLPTSASADVTSKKKYRSAKVPKGYGFLPGYRPPPPNGPIFEKRGRAARYYDLPRYDDPSRVHMWGGSGNWQIYRGRMMGPVFGPCWKHTPIGPTWTCG